MSKRFPGISELVSGRADSQRQCLPVYPCAFRHSSPASGDIISTARTSAVLGGGFGVPESSYGSLGAGSQAARYLGSPQEA